MARFKGKVGIALVSETSPDVYQETIDEISVYGDYRKKAFNLKNGSGLVQDVSYISTVEIVAPIKLLKHWNTIRYIEGTIGGVNDVWSVTSVGLDNPPRMTLSIGDHYNGDRPS